MNCATVVSMRRETTIIHMPPMGLREAVLRVSMESPWEQHERTRSSVLSFARACWRGEICGIDQWIELQKLCGVPEDRLGSLYTMRKKNPK